MSRVFILTILVMIFVGITASTNSFSQGGSGGADSLKGLNSIGIGVSIAEIDTDAATDGLDKNKLQKMVTEKLKKSGIKVLTDLELSTIAGQPKLVVTINAVKQPGPIYIFTTTLDLSQIVVLQRNRGLTAVSPTWTVLTTGGALPEDLYKSVEASLGPMLDSFISDYKKANP